MSRLEIDVQEAERSSRLWIIDWYLPGIGKQSKERSTTTSLKLSDIGIDRRRRFEEMARRPGRLHLDDNWSVVFEQNDEKAVVALMRTKVIEDTRSRTEEEAPS